MGLISVLLGLIHCAQAQPVITESFRYPSGALSIQARQCTPDSRQFAAPHPLILFNHGGTDGINRLVERRMHELCARGYFVVASSYRGEDGSDGQIEVALGEVDDVLSLYRFVATDPNFAPRFDTRRVAMLGFSHGALIGLQALKQQRAEFPVRAMVFAYGVADIAAWYGYLQRSNQLGQDALSQQVFGRGPKLDPDRFALRNGLRGLDAFPKHVAMLIVQGQRDRIVPPEQAELLKQALHSRQRKVQLHLAPESDHGFLIRREALRGAEKRESDGAWELIYQFLSEQTGAPQR